MAELAALGLASNIVQFIDFGITLFQEGKQLYDSAEGASAQRLELEAVTSDLNGIAQELQRGALPAPKADSELRKLAVSCEGLAKELLAILEKLKVGEGQNRKWASFKQAVKGQVKDGKIKSIEARLQKYREQLGTRLLYLLNDQNSSVLWILQDLQSENRRLSANTVQELHEIQAALTGEISNALLQRNFADLSPLEERLNDLAEESKKVRKQQIILRSLWFQELKSRKDSIKEAHAETFPWIFHEESSNFRTWLLSGNGIYWIEGKAGCGKSTLMRYITEHSATRSLLESWAGGSQLVISSHYFWNPGSSMQKSQEGLLRTLLYQVFRQCPNMLPEACIDRWQGFALEPESSEPWSRSELLAAFDELSKTASSSFRFCFFVDGLDEFSGRVDESGGREITHEQREHHELVSLLDRLSKTGPFKFCVSSRPWNVFQDAYGEQLNRLKLEDLTRNDIKNVVQAELQQNAKFKKLRCLDLDRNAVAEDILIRSQGVFLWVDLVLKSLIRGLVEGDDIVGLKDRLDAFPSDLEDFFRHMIKNIDPHYREDTIRFFDAAVHSSEPLPLLAFKFLEDERRDRDYALRAAVRPYSASEIDSICKSMTQRLNARCRDLLEVRNLRDPNVREDLIELDTIKVVFLHRTVRDFFLETDPMEQLKDRKTDININLSLCKIMLALIKALPMDMKDQRAVGMMIKFSKELLTYARYSEHQADEASRCLRVQSELTLLDELDRVNCEHTKGTMTHWSALAYSGAEDEKNRSFLRVTVEAGLTNYISWKLDSQQVNARTKFLSSLLCLALHYGRFDSFATLFNFTIPDFEMLHFLLEKGADPNCSPSRIGRGTSWEIFLGLYYVLSHDSKLTVFGPFNFSSFIRSQKTFSIVELLLNNGADPNPEVKHSGESMTIEMALENSLTEQDASLLDALLEQKRRSNTQFNFLRWIGWK